METQIETPEQKRLRIRQGIVDHRAEIRRHSEAIGDLIAECTHHLKPLTEKELADEWMSVGAVCVDCRHDFGWRCKVSPDGVCHYFSEEGQVELIDGRKVPIPEDHDPNYETDDGCIFCGHPDERK